MWASRYFLPVLRLVSELYPRLFPYHPNWKMTETHVAYWRDTASCDHIKPVARGGSSNMDNLATTCYRCNDTKSNWLLAELGWMLQPIANSSWDGLSSRYLELCLRTPAASSEYHRRWRQALIRAASAARISGPESPAP